MQKRYEWTLDDVRVAKRRAELRRLEWAEASNTSAAIECEYWTRELVKKFPEMEYLTHRVYLATIAFTGGEEVCRVVGPETLKYSGAGLRVWHKGSKGKFHKLASSYACDEIVPFIRSVTLLKADGKESVA